VRAYLVNVSGGRLRFVGGSVIVDLGTKGGEILLGPKAVLGGAFPETLSGERVVVTLLFPDKDVDDV